MTAKGTIPDGAAWDAALKHRPKYQRLLGGYFEQYDVKERGVKKWLERARRDWIAAGCPAGGPDFPPLDEPPKMLTWWLAHMTHSPSSKLYAYAGKDPASSKSPAHPAGEPPPDEADAAAAPPSAPARAGRASLDLASITPVDLAGAVQQQRRIVAAALQAHQDALLDGSIAEEVVTIRAKRLDDAMERLRTMEQTHAKFQRENGHLVSLDSVREECTPLLTAMADSLVSALVETLGTPRALAIEFVDQWFASLRESRFLRAAVPALRPTTAAA